MPSAASLAAASLCGRTEVLMPDEVSGDLVASPDDRNRQDRGRRLQFEGRIIGLDRGLAVKPAHFSPNSWRILRWAAFRQDRRSARLPPRSRRTPAPRSV